VETNVNESWNALGQLAFGSVVIVVVGRSIYRLINEWARLAKRAETREDDAEARVKAVETEMAALRQEHINLIAAHHRCQETTAELVTKLERAERRIEHLERLLSGEPDA
jgi:uncharacterized membrane protein YcjF (UPF0283 family)